MKWTDLFSFGTGAFFVYVAWYVFEGGRVLSFPGVLARFDVAWYVFEGGRVLTRGGYSSMTREANPLVFWFEVAALTFIGAAFLAYGLAGLLGYSNVTTKIDTLADRLPVLKSQNFLICALFAMLIAGLGWIVVDELLRTSRLTAGGG